MQGDLLSVTEAAQLRGVSRFTINYWTKRGLRHQRIGRQIVILRADLDAFQPARAGHPVIHGRSRRQNKT